MDLFSDLAGSALDLNLSDGFSINSMTETAKGMLGSAAG